MRNSIPAALAARALFTFTAVALVSSAAIGGDGDASPKLVWKHRTKSALPLRMAIDRRDDRFLYVAAGPGGLQVLRAPRKGRKVAKVKRRRLRGLDVTSVTQSGDRLYLALGNFFDSQAGSKAGLAIVDVRKPRKPRVRSVWVSDEVVRGSSGVVVHEGHAYLAAMNAGVFVLDVSDPNHVERIASIVPDIHFPREDPGPFQIPNARDVALRDDLLFVSYDAGGIRVLDVSDPAAPVEIGRYANPGMLHKSQAYNSLVLDGPYAYAAVDYAGLEIVDVEDPREPRLVGWWNPWSADSLGNLWLNSPGHTNHVALDAGRRLVYLSAGDSELRIVDVSDPAEPVEAAGYGEPRNGRAVWSMTLSPDRVFLGYIEAFVPFRGTWAGVQALER